MARQTFGKESLAGAGGAVEQQVAERSAVALGVGGGAGHRPQPRFHLLVGGGKEWVVGEGVGGGEK